MHVASPWTGGLGEALRSAFVVGGFGGRAG